MRERLQKAVLVTASLLLGIALIWRFHQRRPPYFAAPRTLVDHVDRIEHAQHATILLLHKVRPLIPRGAQVTCFRPHNGGLEADHSNYLTAVAMLPHHVVLPPFTAGDEIPKSELVEYVIAVGKPFANPAYKPIAGFPEGFVYQVER